MANSPIEQNLQFDTELSLAGSSLTGSAVFIGQLSNNPVVIRFANQTNQTVFIADNSGSTKGMTLVAGETVIMDCRANHGRAANMSFPINTSFFATGSSGTGNVKISVLYAR